jgi:hypothetical protein
LLPGSHGNIFSIPYATYAISIDAGALLLGARDPLVNCDSEIPEINAAIQIGGARALWDRSSHASLPFMSQVLQDIAHGTGIRSNQGMMNTVYVKHPCVVVVFFVFFASSTSCITFCITSCIACPLEKPSAVLFYLHVCDYYDSIIFTTINEQVPRGCRGEQCAIGRNNERTTSLGQNSSASADPYFWIAKSTKNGVWGRSSRACIAKQRLRSVVVHGAAMGRRAQRYCCYCCCCYCC